MKLALLTFHFNYNYGAVLQAYATIKVLEELGHSVIIPDYLPPHMVTTAKLYRGLSVKKYGVVDALRRRVADLPRRAIFDSFRRSHLPLASGFRGIHDLTRRCNEVEGFLVGSDQVWNMSWMADFDPFYFLGFLPEEYRGRRVSYSSCFGTVGQSADYLTRITPFLRKFDRIAVRNRMSSDILKSLGFESDRVLDPTLLHNFSEFATNEKADAPQILIYSLDEDNLPRGRIIAEKIRAETGCKIVYIAADKGGGAWADEYLPSVSPQEWVRLFSESAYIVTDSFHGCVFAAKFRRNFVAYSEGWRSSRLSDFLCLCGLDSRLVLDEAGAEQATKIIRKLPDYDYVAGVLGKNREHSLAYLKAAFC